MNDLKKNSLGVVTSKKPNLLKFGDQSREEVPASAPPEEGRATVKSKKKMGRAPKAAKDKETNRVQIYFTDEVYEELRKRAGLASVPAYIKHLVQQDIAKK